MPVPKTDKKKPLERKKSAKKKIEKKLTVKDKPKKKKISSKIRNSPKSNLPKETPQPFEKTENKLNLFIQELKIFLKRFSPPISGKFPKIFFRQLFTVILFLLVGIFTLPLLPFKQRIDSFVVLSGSMEPALPVGGLIIIQEQEDYQTGEIITFTDPTNSQNLITHRIHEIKESDEETEIITQGDANGTPDSFPINSDAIKGKVIISLPFLGYLIHFSQTGWGLILLIILPAVILIGNELKNIRQEIEKNVKEKIAKEEKIKKPRKKQNDEN